jgi:hypothetical protein
MRHMKADEGEVFDRINKIYRIGEGLGLTGRHEEKADGVFKPISGFPHIFFISCFPAFMFSC